MRYLIANALPDVLPAGCRVVGDGETRVLEQPWTLGAATVILLDDAALEIIASRMAGVAGFRAFALGCLEQPGDGAAFMVAGQIMRDAERFRPYSATIADVLREFGGRFLAAGAVTPVAGDYTPERAVVVEFPTADAAMAFYASDIYAPLLKLRLATTEPQLILMARSGALPAGARAAAEGVLRIR